MAWGPPGGPPWPGQARVRFEWLEGRTFLIQRWTVELPEATVAAEVREALRPIEHELLTGAVRLIASGTVRPDPSHPRRVLVGGTA